MVSTDISIWIAAFFTIAVTTYVFKDNIIFKFAENTFIGVAAGHAVVMAVRNAKMYGIDKILAGEYIYLVSIILGILMYFRFSKTAFWVYRYAIAFLVGQGVGIAMRAGVHADFLQMVATTAKPLVVSGDVMGSINSILVFVLVITALLHFVFTVAGIHKGALSVLPRIGRYGMLLGFGAAFGNTVMTRFGMYQGRVLFLLRDWLGLVGS